MKETIQKLVQNLKHQESWGLNWKNVFWLGEKMSEDKSNYSFLRCSFLVKDWKKFINYLRLNFELGIWFESIARGRKLEFDKIGYQVGSCPAEKKSGQIYSQSPNP